MSSDLDQLKKELRALVVSSPTQVDLRSLARDYRENMGRHIPISQYGYRDLFTFLKERCSDSFLISGSAANPVLTLIVSDSLKHIDQFVRKQKMPSTAKFKGKRISIPESVIRPKPIKKQQRSSQDSKKPETNQTQIRKPETKTVENQEEIKQINKEGIKQKDIKPIDSNQHNNINKRINNSHDPQMNNQHDEEPTVNGQTAVQKFFKKRLPMLKMTDYRVGSAADQEYVESSPEDDEASSRITTSSSSSSKRALLEELRLEVRELIADHPEGIWAAELMRLYRCRFGRELPLQRLGHTSVVSLSRELTSELRVRRPERTGDWLLLAVRAPSPPRTAPRPSAHRVPHLTEDHRADSRDALPGIDFEPSVFPSDCLHFIESVPSSTLRDIVPGAALELCVGEVYSPSHLWVIRLGPKYNLAMEDIMDEMNNYYRNSAGDGARRLTPGAIRVGHYCAAPYEGDWHRSIIVRVLDSTTVKVRHIDYGTVTRVPTDSLAPLRREWAALPAQAMRARLAGVAPPRGAGRWPRASAAATLQLVRDVRLVGSVTAVDTQEDILELFLVNTATSEDLCINEELISGGFADRRRDSSLHVSVSSRPSPRSGSGSSSAGGEADVGSLLTAISAFQRVKENDCDTLSDISASASEVVDSGPRRIKTWECEDSNGTLHSNESVHSSISIQSQRLARLKALHQQMKRREMESETESEKDSSSCVDSVVSVGSRMLQRRLELVKKLRNGHV